MFRKLASQLTSSYIVVILFSMGILGFYMLDGLAAHFESELRDSLGQQAHLLATTWSSYLEEGPVDEKARHHLEELARSLKWQTGSRLRVLGGKEGLLTDTGGPESPDLVRSALVQQALEGQVGSSTEPGAGSSERQLCVAYPIRVRRPDPQHKGTFIDSVEGAVLAERPMTYLHSSLTQQRNLFLVGTFISLLVSGTLSLFLSRYLTGPLLAMTAAAEKLAGGDLSAQLPTYDRNEVGELAERFNFMARQLQGSTSRLLEERHKLEVVLAHMADGVVMLDAEGQVVLSNRNADQMLAPQHQRDSEQLMDMLRTGMQMAAEREHEQVGETLLQGGRVAKIVFSPVLGEHGQLQGCVVLLHDITELTRLAEMKTEFVSNVSHELKTPLAAVKGLAEILLDGAMHEPEGDRFLRSIGRETDRMTRLVSDLLNLSKIEGGVVRMEVRAFDLGALVSDLVSGYRARPRNARLQLGVQVDSGDDGAVVALGDPDRVEQVVVNLLDNAVRYSPEDSGIDVRVYRVGALCQVDVRDQGVGIPPEALDLIFERFYRVDRARSREQGGTGLGLSIARQILERLQGRIWGYSEGEGTGSTFSFQLPAARLEDIVATEELEAVRLEGYEA